jgi:hypothetical protein
MLPNDLPIGNAFKKLENSLLYCMNQQHKNNSPQPIH